MDVPTRPELQDAISRAKADIGQRPCILIVVDNDCVRSFVCSALKLEGWTVLSAADGDEALEIYQQHRSSISLVLVDVQMPHPDGPHTVAVLRAMNPALRFCFLSACTGRYTEQHLFAKGALHVLYKPFAVQALLRI